MAKRSKPTAKAVAKAVWKYLDVSTIHITVEDDRVLHKEAELVGRQDLLGLEAGLIVYGYDQGYWVHVPEEDLDFKVTEYGYSTAMDNLLKLARKNGCAFIRLDADGTKIEGLEELEWP